MKALVDTCADVAQFPPGHYFDSASGELVRYYQQSWRAYADVQGRQADLAELRRAFEHAVERQLMSDVPYGVLLSGGRTRRWWRRWLRAMHVAASRMAGRPKPGGRACIRSRSA